MFWFYKLCTVVYCFPDLILVCFSRVCLCDLETVICYEVVDFQLILLYG